FRSLVRHGRGGVHSWTGVPTPGPASSLAGTQSLARIRIHRAADLSADGDVPFDVHGGGGKRRGTRQLVGAYAGAADLPSTDSAYQAPAPRAQSRDDFPQAERVQPNSTLGGRRGLRARYGQRYYSTGRPASLLVRRVRPLHRALSSLQYGQDSGSKK